MPGESTKDVRFREPPAPANIACIWESGNRSLRASGVRRLVMATSGEFVARVAELAMDFGPSTFDPEGLASKDSGCPDEPSPLTAYGCPSFRLLRTFADAKPSEARMEAKSERTFAIGRARLTVQHRVFLWKSVSVLALTALVLPLLRLKDGMPAVVYVGALLLLHVVVLALYLYRTRVRSLDGDWHSLVARVAALAFMAYLLAVVSRPGASASNGVLIAKIVAVSVLHIVILALLNVRAEFGRADSPGRQPAARPVVDE